MSDPLFSVAGQRVLAVGASRGIGRAIAGGFALRGARVTIVGRVAETLAATAAELSRSAEHPVETLVCDVADPEQVERRIGELQEQDGPFDTLLMVAGINRRKPATELSRDEFDAVIDINLKGAWHVAQVVGRPMLERGRGNQIHVTSLNVDRPLPRPPQPAASARGLRAPQPAASARGLRALPSPQRQQGVSVPSQPAASARGLRALPARSATSIASRNRDISRPRVGNDAGPQQRGLATRRRVHEVASARS
jgi:NAD(P)-dependent dehydrogenase (short-subunit alcohol dehydrogenase family)